MKKLSPFLITFLFFYFSRSNAQIAIIPKPNDIKIKDGICSLKKGINFKTIRGDEPTKIIQKQVIDFLSQKNIPISISAPTVLSINLLQKKATDTIFADAYNLSISPNNIAITSYTNEGLFYGLQSLYQLINTDSLKILPYLEIKDKPAFSYRGFELDVCQHFFGIDVVKKYIDAISKLKMNQFVWKLADEKFWRIDTKNNIKSFSTDSENDNVIENKFYTKQEIKEVLQYAKERFVNVIPEINFAQIVASEDTALLYKKSIIDEILALFPSKYLNIDNPIFITEEIEAYLKSSGKIIISKDDALFKNSIVLNTKSIKSGLAAAKKGNDVINAPHNMCALDNYQNWDDSKLSKTMLYLPLEKTYSFDPISKSNDVKTNENIIGSQANVNTKFISNDAILSNQIYPRIFALAECFWTNKNNKKSFKEFNARAEKIGYPGQITEKINMIKFK